MKVAIAFWGILVLGQAAAQPNAQPPAPDVRIDSVWDFVVKGGPVMIPIGLCSLAALTVIVERMTSLRRRVVLPPDFLPGLKQVLDDSKGDRQKALDYCRIRSGPLAQIFAAGIKKLGEPVEVVERHIQETGRREIVKLRRFLRSLSVIASISPLLGLLGTIFGMITAFQTVAASAEALGRTELLAKGIYEAMITTAAGLLVAIPSVLAYHAIVARVDRLVFEMDAMTIEFVEQYASAGWKTPRRSLSIPGSASRNEDVVFSGSDSDGRTSVVAGAA